MSIEMANQLESDNIEPYIISSDMYFRSTFTYPRIIKNITNSPKNSQGGLMIPHHGDTLLEIYVASTDNIIFELKINEYNITSINNKIKLFTGGLPLINKYNKHYPTPFIYGINNDNIVIYGVYENYGDTKRKKLFNTINLKVKDYNNNDYLI